MHDSKILEIVSRYNLFWQTGQIESGILRELLPVVLRQLTAKEVVVLNGVRRSGKSTLMAQIIAHLLANHIPPKQILRINFEEPLFALEYGIPLLEQIYRTYREKICPVGKCWLFLDEVQNVPEWELWVRGRIETEDVKIFITGSSARMLSREIGTRLTGRQLSFEVHPLSFREFLHFNDIRVAGELDYVTQLPTIRNQFQNYLRYGGFPEVVLKPEEADKALLLKHYFEDILYRDVAARHEIRDTANLLNLAVYLLTQTARLTSIHKLKNNFSISQDKTENYVSAILESFLIFQLKKFSFSLKNMQRAGFKPYAIDTGLRNRVAFSFSEDIGWLVENLIFSHLRRSHDEIYFDAHDAETDFVVKQGMNITQRIQIWYDDPAVSVIPARELAAFKTVNRYYRHASCLLITNDYEDTIEVGAAMVRCIPIVKYLLFDAV